MAVTINGTTGLATDSATADVDGFAQLSVSNDGAAAIIADRTTSDGTIIDVQKSGTTVGSIGNTGSRIYLGSGDVGAAFQSDVDKRFYPVDPSNGGAGKDAYIDLGRNSVRWKDLYLSGGVYLGGTGSANLLDDYEEGTYTANLNVTGGSISYDSNTLTYTKIGRLVFVQGRIVITTVSSPTGFMQISLPFTVSTSGKTRYSQLNITFYGVDLTNGAVENMFTVESGTSANWLQSFDNGVWQVLGIGALGGSEQIQVSGFYITDS